MAACAQRSASNGHATTHGAGQGTGQGFDRRKYRRIPVRYEAYLHYDGADHGKIDIKDLSAFGFRIHAEDELPLGAGVLVRLQSQGAERNPIILSANVVRCEPAYDDAGYYIGCQLG